jgi:glycosyltransferase involved in cell wall biosynthesis
MLIALNLLYLRPGLVGGTETYAAGLLAGLHEVAGRERFLVLLNRQAAAWAIPDSPRFERVVCPVDGRRQLTRYLFEQGQLPALLWRRGADLVHSLGYVSPLVTACPRVVTIHDVNYLAFGAQMRRLQRIALRTFVPLSAHRAHAILTPSDFSREQIVEHLHVSREHVTVTPEGQPASSDTVRRAHDGAVAWRPVAGPYLIAFGSTTPNKNLERLIDAVRFCTPSLRLVVVGHVTPALRQLCMRVGVVLTGYLDASHLNDALLGSDALVFPSLYEGFGLPVLEAMSLGVPVVCSNAASLPEVGGDAVRYFDPRDVTDMRARIAEVASNASLRAALRQRGLARAARFTWRATAERTLGVYRHVLAARSTTNG